MSHINASELRARFGGRKLSLIEQYRLAAKREGKCLCGADIAKHFDEQNNKIDCADIPQVRSAAPFADVLESAKRNRQLDEWRKK